MICNLHKSDVVIIVHDDFRSQEWMANTKDCPDHTNTGPTNNVLWSCEAQVKVPTEWHNLSRDTIEVTRKAHMSFTPLARDGR